MVQSKSCPENSKMRQWKQLEDVKHMIVKDKTLQKTENSICICMVQSKSCPENSKMRQWKQLEEDVHYIIVISPLLVWVHGNVGGPDCHGNSFEPQQYVAEIFFFALPISQSVSQQ